jgi:drug/metabolite transporter (DMT)-like permease
MSSAQGGGGAGGGGAGLRADGLLTIILTLASWTAVPLMLRHFATSEGGEPLIDGWTANGWRYGFSALIWLPAILIGLSRRRLPKGLWRMALVPAAFNTAAQVCFGIAPYYIDPGLMTFSLRLQIVFVTIGAIIMFPAERRVIRSGGYLTGIGLVVAGTCITLMANPEGLGGGTATGVMLAIGAGLLYGAYALSVRKCLHGVNPITAFAAISIYTAAGMIGLMFIFGAESGADVLGLRGGQITLLLVSSLIGIGIGHTLYFYSIGRLGLAVSTGVVQLQPITVSVASLFVFGEKLTPIQWTSGLIAITGAGVMLWTQHRMMARAGARVPVAPIDAFDDLPVDPDVAMIGQANEPAPDRHPAPKSNPDKPLPVMETASPPS